MRFNCGPTPEEKYEELVKERMRLREWHDYFAWKPARLGRFCYWLQTIQRQSPECWVYRGHIIDKNYKAQYRLKEDK